MKALAGFAGGYRTILKTINGGADWTIQRYTFAHTTVYRSIFFIDENTGWASYRDCIILNSTDGGETWVTQLSGINNVVSSVYFVDSNTGWAVGSNGTILKTTNGGVTFVEGEEELPYKFALKQNYPNPFNPSTKISFKLAETGFTSLKVYDVLGNEIATLVNEEKPAGTYKVNFDASELSSGIYFYKLQTDGFVETKRMILLR